LKYVNGLYRTAATSGIFWVVAYKSLVNESTTL
jgi:hypothetical protein